MAGDPNSQVVVVEGSATSSGASLPWDADSLFHVDAHVARDIAKPQASHDLILRDVDPSILPIDREQPDVEG